MEELTYNNCLFAARKVIKALHEIEETWCCLAGDMAMRLHGFRREVKSLEILVVRPETNKAAIQQALTQYDSDRFFTLSARKQSNGPRLYYRIPRTPHSIKVDLLLSDDPDDGVPDNLHTKHFEEINDLNVAPFHFLLFQEIARWSKVGQDPDSEDEVEDSHKAIMRIGQLLDEEDFHPLKKTHLGREYLDGFSERVRIFCSYYGSSARSRFRAIGFDV